MTAQEPIPNSPSNNAVELVEGAGEWFVRVVEGSHVTTRSFDSESEAAAFAENQRARLGLGEVVRL